MSAVNAVLLTAGDPDALTGGSLYHRRIADRAPRFGVEIDIRSIRGVRRPGRLARGADVVIIDSIVAARMAGAGHAAPLVASVHQRPGGLTGALVRRVLRAAGDVRLYRHADAVVVPSVFLARQLGRAGVAGARIHVVEPGCASDATVGGPLSPGRRTTTGVSFVCVANLSPHKRPLDLLDAFARIGDLDASMTLVGDGTDRQLAVHVVERLASPDLAGRARWIGALPPGKVASLVAASDVFVLPAIHESYGIAVAEALRAGVPAIVARSGNLPNLVRDGADGYVVPPRDVASLAAAMRQLASDPARRLAMGTLAAARGGRLPSWDVAAERFCAVVRAVQGGIEAPRRSAA